MQPKSTKAGGLHREVKNTNNRVSNGYLAKEPTVNEQVRRKHQTMFWTTVDKCVVAWIMQLPLNCTDVRTNAQLCVDKCTVVLLSRQRKYFKTNVCCTFIYILLHILYILDVERQVISVNGYAQTTTGAISG